MANNPTPITVHGIRNCDTVRKACQWLDAHGIAYRFHDFKTQGVPVADLDRWIARLGWEPLVNRQGLTWRRLDDATRERVTDAASARALLLAQPSLIKRPVVDWAADGSDASVGFRPADWAPRAPRG